MCVCGRGGWAACWPLDGFVLRCLKFKFLALLLNSQLVASCQLSFYSYFVLFGSFVLNYLSGVPVK